MTIAGHRIFTWERWLSNNVTNTCNFLYLTSVEGCKLPVLFMINQETTLTLRCQGFRYLSSCRAGWTPFLLTGTMQGCLKDLFIVWIVLYNFQHSALQLNSYSFVWHWCTSRNTHPPIQNSEGDLHMTYMWLCTASESSASCGPRMELIRLRIPRVFGRAIMKCSVTVEPWWLSEVRHFDGNEHH